MCFAVEVLFSIVSIVIRVKPWLHLRIFVCVRIRIKLPGLHLRVFVCVRVCIHIQIPGLHLRKFVCVRICIQNQTPGHICMCTRIHTQSNTYKWSPHFELMNPINKFTDC